jgi:segregation and condensation protein A
MDKPTFKITDFEGPLDLLLHLISKHKLNICDIEIAQLLEQYVVFLEHSGGNLEVASEFLEMAARLVHIKTMMLLPRHEKEGEALKTELQNELAEYRVCQLLAGRLRRMMEDCPRYVRSQADIQVDRAYTLTHSPALLRDAYLAAMGRVQRRMPPPPSAFSGIVARRVVSVTSRIVYLLRRFYKEPVLPFDAVFAGGQDRCELVATFMALLELVRGGRVLVSGDGATVSFDRGRQNP